MPPILILLLTLSVILISIPLHESIHYLVAVIVNGDPKFGMDLKRFDFYVEMRRKFLSRRDHIIIYLAPILPVALLIGWVLSYGIGTTGWVIGFIISLALSSTDIICVIAQKPEVLHH